MGTPHKESRRKNKRKKWLIEAIFYWETRQDEAGLGVDWAEAHERCWRCGYESELQRCHIIPVSLGGSDDVSNVVALCVRCHDEAPNVNDAAEMWRWIRKTAVPYYDTFWSLQAYKEAVVELGLSDTDMDFINPDEFCNAVKELISEIGFHCGQISGGIRVTTSSYVWLIRKAFLKVIGAL